MGFLRNLAARKRITLNQVFFVAVFIFLMHPRNRFFFAAGFFIGLFGSFLRIWAKGTLQHGVLQLTASGPYRFTRHPMYLGTLLQWIGLWLACFSLRWFFSWVVLLLALGLYFIFVYKEAMLLEEEDMYGRHGQLWEEYTARTPALFPRPADLKSLRWSDFKSFHFHNFENSREWNNFLMFLGVCLLLWIKLVYRLY